MKNKNVRGPEKDDGRNGKLTKTSRVKAFGLCYHKGREEVSARGVF